MEKNDEKPFVQELGETAAKSCAAAIGACLGIVLVHALTTRSPAAITPTDTPTQ